MIPSRLLACLLAAALCQPAPAAYAGVQPFVSAADMGHLSEEEERVWDSGREFDDALRKNGSMYTDAELDQYLQSIADRLFPEFPDRIHVHVVRSPELNAFALPNGSIYINLGILARMDNEAQLATLIGHEGTHVINRHGFQERQGVKSASVFSLGVALIGIPFIGDLIGMSSIYGFSREKEKEADDFGFKRMVKAGYDPHESVKVFEHLLAEVKALDIKQSYFFSSHPKLKNRIDDFNKLIAKQKSGGKIGKEVFLEKTRQARLDNLENEISMNRYKSVILELEDKQRRTEYPAQALFYLGEAYHQRGKDGDNKLAQQLYEQVIADTPEFAPSYRALGILCMQRKDYPSAEQNLGKYLALAADAKDAGYMRQYYELAKKKETQQ